MSFEKLQVKQEIVKALHEQGITSPTDIQEQAIPLLKEGKDLIGISQTGSGKTLAFSVPILENITPRKGIQAMVIAPTRELAVQIAAEMQKFGKYMGCKTTAIYGKVALEPQIQSLATADIVVGTPGRILDHLERKTLLTNNIKHVVLDEADKLVDMGFIEDIKRILNHTPKEKQMSLFGATISQEVESIKRTYMQNPVTIKVQTLHEDLLEQFYYDVPQKEKFSLLVHLLNKEQTKRVIIFCSKITTVDLLTQNLRNNKLIAEKIHGRMAQPKRLRVMQDFNKGRPNILVASAVAARGIDIKEVTHVFNYDLAQDAQEYIHRIGRTARAGESGKAITLLSERDYPAFDNIRRNYKIKIEKLQADNFQRLQFDARSAHGHQGGFSQRRFERPQRSHERPSYRPAQFGRA